MGKVVNIKWDLTPKQAIALEYLIDNKTNEILYGGAAGSGKSMIGCIWLLMCCLKYPKTRWAMGRAHLKNLKESTLLTFFEICSKSGLKAGKDYKYNSIEGVIKFPKTKSEIYLKDMFAYPSDPQFDKFGSTEFTGGFIDECSEISLKAKNILTSRFRYKLNEYNLVPKLLICSNPTKNFIYKDFYKPFTENKLPPYRKYVPALPGDNPYLPKAYLENLKKLDETSKQRLLYGNWEYDDDPAKLFEYEKILDIFTLKTPQSEKKYITCDVARHGKDKTVIIQWLGLQITNMISYRKQNTKYTADLLKKLSEDNQIPRSHIIVDEDGIGGGVKDNLENIKGFVNNSTPIDPIKKDISGKRQNYTNLKSQCYFYLADYINNSRIGCNEIKEEYKLAIIEDLEQIRRHNIDKDDKFQVEPKNLLIERLGRSPDFADAMMMRMWFEIKEILYPKDEVSISEVGW